MCEFKHRVETFKCISEDVCPMSMWQGARGHTVKEVDDDWALLSFGLRKNKAINKDSDRFMTPKFTWDKVCGSS